MFMEPTFKVSQIRAIIGLGNPGQKYSKNRHNIGFRVLDYIADQHSAAWQTAPSLEYATMRATDGHELILVKPQTFMNNSGNVMGWLQKKGIKPDQILVVHDELEKKFGQLVFKFGGSHKGHNGLRSIMGMVGPDFWRLKFGIGRPAEQSQVSGYVLENFSVQEEELVPGLIQQAMLMIISNQE
jgi:PTH1 family peptidyl-tRNA hydrolase